MSMAGCICFECSSETIIFQRDEIWEVNQLQVHVLVQMIEDSIGSCLEILSFIVLYFYNPMCQVNVPHMP